MTEKKPTKSEKPSEVAVTFQPAGRTCTVARGRTLTAAAAAAAIDLRADCGGKGKCGQCAVHPRPAEHLSALTDSERRLLSADALDRGRRLACQVRAEGALEVDIEEATLAAGEVRSKDLGGLTVGGPAAERSGPAKGSLGLALDIGTTTLALYLCDLSSGAVVHSAAAHNPQRRYGADVISRIAHASSTGGGLEELRTAVVEEINRLLSRSLEATGLAREKIGAATAVGNTTMQHIFAGRHPGPLGIAPYMPESCEAQVYPAADLGVELGKGCDVYLFPVVSGFVGGDTVAAMLSAAPHRRDDITLLIDIGTNGEVVLGNRERIWVTSCATGPALEGAHISCGMRAAAGAIDKVRIEPASFRVEYEMIGGAAGTVPRGVCGSGIVDAVAAMLEAGLILPSGRLAEGQPGVVVDRDGVGREFTLVDAPGQPRVSLTLADIRQVQLAKSALYTGITMLMRKAGLETFDRLVLTGAFGARFNWRNAVRIGMLPEGAEEAEVELVENGAGRGAVMALLDEGLREEARSAAAGARLLELAGDPGFSREFTAHTAFRRGA